MIWHTVGKGPANWTSIDGDDRDGDNFVHLVGPWEYHAQDPNIPFGRNPHFGLLPVSSRHCQSDGLPARGMFDPCMQWDGALAR